MNKKIYEKKECLNCKKEFTPKSKVNKFCCYDCSYKFGRKSYIRKFIPQQKNCKECGIEFLKRRQQQIFCCKNCSDIFYKKQYYNPSLDIDNKNKLKSFLKLRFEILKRDNFQCQYCGRTPRKDKCKLQIEHIIPKSRGGISEINNLITSCQECNSGKGDTLLEERQLNKILMKNETKY